MRESRHRRIGDAPDEFPEPRGAAQVERERQGIEEAAGHRLEFQQLAVGDRCADEHLLLRAVPREHHAERGEQNAMQGAAAAPGQFAQPLGKLGFDAHPQPGAAMSLDGGTRVVGQQLEDARRVP